MNSTNILCTKSCVQNLLNWSKRLSELSRSHRHTKELTFLHYPQVRGHSWLRSLIQSISQNTNQLSNLELLLSLKGRIFNRICSGKLLVESEGIERVLVSRVGSWERLTKPLELYLYSSQSQLTLWEQTQWSTISSSHRLLNFISQSEI